MRLKPLLIPLAVAGFAGLAAQSALAGPSGYPVQQPPPPVWGAGTFAVRVGAAYVDPDSDDVLNTVQSFVVTDPDEIVDDIPVDVGTRVDLDSETTWFLNATYVFMDHWAIELYSNFDAGHEATLYSDAFFADTGEFIGEFSEGLGDFDSTTTSLFLDWYFLDPTCLWQPYVGIGAAYVNIEEDFVRPVFNTDNRFGAGRIGFGSDFSWTAQVGVDFVFGRESNWLANASVMYVDAQPDLYIGYDTLTDVGLDEDEALQVRVRDEMDFDPWIFNLGIGYKFSF